jgi:hypothetical protein
VHDEIDERRSKRDREAKRNSEVSSIIFARLHQTLSRIVAPQPEQ